MKNETIRKRLINDKPIFKTFIIKDVENEDLTINVRQLNTLETKKLRKLVLSGRKDESELTEEEENKYELISFKTLFYTIDLQPIFAEDESYEDVFGEMNLNIYKQMCELLSK